MLNIYDSPLFGQKGKATNMTSFMITTTEELETFELVGHYVCTHPVLVSQWKIKPAVAIKFFLQFLQFLAKQNTMLPLRLMRKIQQVDVVV